MKKNILFLLPFLLSIALGADETPLKINPEADPDHFFREFMNMLSTLGLILVGMLILAWIVKRFTKSRLEQINTTSSIKILESRPLSNKSTLHLIEVEGTGFVIAENAQSVTKVGEFKLYRELN